jgi:hypothetical protein
MAAHIAHCVAKLTPMGDLVSNDKRGSPCKIDAAVAAIMRPTTMRRGTKHETASE